MAIVHNRLIVDNNDCLDNRKIMKRGKAMCKEYVFNYKVFSLPYWYVFTCYAKSNDDAISQFLRENPIGIESYRIVHVNNI